MDSTANELERINKERALVKEVSKLRKELSNEKKQNKILCKKLEDALLDDEAAKTAQSDFLKDFYND